MKHGRIELYIVILIAFGMAFIFFPKIGSTGLGDFLNNWTLPEGRSTYGFNYSGLFLTTGFVMVLITSFLMMGELERKVDKFMEEIKVS